jgi:transposase
VSPEGLRGWVNRDKAERGAGRPGELTSTEREELKRLRKENAELRMEKDIRRKAAAYFAKETTR